ncbi:uncharacterized protein TRIADDRAFT_59024 [Trichoplax adhaerens]|uniref:G-protein coupled receptors family 3 profile domain-containing protein n=1 Tax=Trichoplax adhaerens TaxID=10228 RepID=B3S4B5_TRIAD|nr:hypothetical protein TRIADDRAFT_59024 [Trichoplax adhaerens]EDV22610.1 hypothetical protein TRIADDRAFT_59024 [Trichoplax adhaerens]|eukprot:XP_002115154.1 hypothetical protein TRIADDRAFT_59024 [Trichoplax adhaerens]
MENNKTILYLGTLHPLSQGFAINAANGYLQAVMLAIRDVNNRQDILKDYKLDNVVLDTQHNSAYAIKQFFKLVSNKPQKMIIYGPILSPNCEAVAAISKYWNLLVTARDLRQRAKLANMEILASETFSSEVDFHLARIKESKARIIMVLAYPSDVLSVICSAFKQNLYGPKYVWFLSGWFYSNWMFQNYDENKLNCSINEILKVLDGYFAFKGVNLPDLKEPRLSGYTPDQFLTEYKNFGNRTHLTGTFPYAYDAVWSIALGLNTTDHILKKYHGHTLADFNYKDILTRSIFQEALNNVSFIGISGKIKFVDGNRIGNVKYMQYQRNKYINYTLQVGFYDVFNDSVSINESFVAWKGKKIPMDHVRIVVVNLGIGFGVFIVFAVLSGIGILFALSIIAFNISKRSTRIVKITSPRINVLMLAGSVCCYLAIVLFGLDWSIMRQDMVKYACTIATWQLSIGFTLGFGALFCKTWRIYAIYRNKFSKKVNIKDRHVILRLISLVMIDLIILTCWQIINPLETTVQDLPNKRLMSVNGEVETFYNILVCRSENMSIWLGVTYGYKFLVMIFGAFLAWETRYVHIQELNDSKLIAVSIYNVALLSTVGVILHEFTFAEPHIAYALVASFIFFATTITTCIIFIPTMKEFVRNRKTISSNTNNNSNVGNRLWTSGTKGSSKLYAESEDINQLKEEIYRHKMIIEEMKSYLISKGIPYEGINLE